MLSTFVKRLNSISDRWLFDGRYATSRSLGLFRIIYALYFLLVLTPNHHKAYTFAPFGDLPDEFFAPPLGPMRFFFDEVPSVSVLSLLTAVLVCALLLVLVGLHTRFASLTVAGTLFLLEGFMFSFGKIDHDFHFILLPFLMAFSGWGDTYSLDSLKGGRDRLVRSEADGTWPVPVVALAYGLMLATAGVGKVFGGWLTPETSATHFYIIDFDLQERDGLLTGALAGLPAGILWKPLDYAVILLEVGFLAACLSPRFLRSFAAMAILFHFGIMLSLNISFASALIVYALFVPWDRIADRARLHRFEDAARRWLPLLNRPAVVIAGLSVAAGLLYYAGSPLFLVERLPFANDIMRTVTPIDTLAITVAAVIAVVTLYLASLRALAALRQLPLAVGRAASGSRARV